MDCNGTPNFSRIRKSFKTGWSFKEGSLQASFSVCGTVVNVSQHYIESQIYRYLLYRPLLVGVQLITALETALFHLLVS